MTCERLEKEFLSLRYWIRKFVIPVSLVLLLALILLRLTVSDSAELDKVSVVLGFLALYYLLVRGGHLYMIRTLHFQIKTEFIAVYPQKLAELPLDLKYNQIGSELAKIKADLYRRSK